MPFAASRPRIPAIYGVPTDEKGLLPWSHVDQRMTEARHYWVATVAPDGGPHTRPVDGMWLDATLYFGGSEETRWRRNLAVDPRACVNLEPGEQAVILHGVVALETPDATLAARLAEASNAKYDYGQTAATYEGKEVLAFRPETAFAWTLLYRDATRFRRTD
ncbi:MAG TPA: pyridoxamine 5'-phosphate oxidase family protein [Thermoanaerobaculia bacterium]|nr:pyridoxamine 5'-phosphate oxidase family protein [Thermoanaerobaculia bacterium]